MSLQLAVKYENAVLDLKILHEASILNRKDTIEALDELKQRIALQKPLSRTLPGSPEALSDPRSSSESVQTSRSPPASPVPDAYVPKAVGTPAEGDSKSESSGLARYFSMQRKNSKTSITARKPSLAAASESINFHPALNYLLNGRTPDERKAIMRDIDEIIASYQGLRVEGDRAEALAMLTGRPDTSKRDTLAVLHGGNGYQRDTIGLNRDAAALLKELPPIPGKQNIEYPAYTHNIFEGHIDRRASEWIDHPQPAPLVSRWSTTSAGSSIYSQRTICSDPPSLYRNDSISSRGSPVSPPDPPSPRPLYSSQANSVYSTVPFWPLDRMQQQYPPNSSLASSRTNSPPVAAFSVPPRAITPTYPAPRRPQTPVKEKIEGLGLSTGKTRVHLVPGEEYRYKADPSVKLLPPLNLRKSHSSSNLSNPTRKLSNSGLSPNAGQEKMMDGRPCKDNNYWGFCKGAWAMREDLKKGLGLESRPEGMYNTSQIWQCKHCCFEGPSYAIPHPTKKNKKEIVVDPNIHVAAVGIRYRWAFLAKSHVKKSNFASSNPNKTPHSSRMGTEDGDVNYGCVICSVEGNVTGIYGNVETLMNHIFMEHVRPGSMSDATMLRSKLIMGRTAGAEEEWDVNVPMEDVLLF